MISVRDRLRALDVGDLDELSRDERAGERGTERISAVADGAGLKRRQHEAAREVLARVEHVSTDGANCQRAFAHVVERAALSDVQRQRDDFRAVLPGKPRDCGGRFQSARIRKNDPVH